MHFSVGCEFLLFLPGIVPGGDAFEETWNLIAGHQEFGSCTFEGAPQRGGMGWSVVDHRADPPDIKGNVVRSEPASAAHVTDVRAAFEAMSRHVAHAFAFISPDSPHRPDGPRHDLDTASYALVKPSGLSSAQRR